MQTLMTGRLELVPLDPDRDAESLHAMYGVPEFYLYGPSEPTSDVAATRRRLAAEVTRSGGWTWVLRLRSRAEALGTIGLFSDQGGPIRGLSWGLRPDSWGQGLMGEAAPVVVDHLLAQPGIDGVEAWIDTRNSRSLGVARRARLDERARLARVYADHTAQQVVMARAAEPVDSDVVAIRPSLPVRDVGQTCKRLTSVLGLSPGFLYGDPPTFARLGVGPWSGSPGIALSAEDEITAAAVSVDIGVPTEVIYHRAVAVGMKIISRPADQPWHTREFVFCLPEGHQIRVIGPARPPSRQPTSRTADDRRAMYNGHQASRLRIACATRSPGATGCMVRLPDCRTAGGRRRAANRCVDRRTITGQGAAAGAVGHRRIDCQRGVSVAATTAGMTR
ncbi:MAG: GNAT family N-acetyltransferase [Microlunatus sp.]|nr:GNAT family N-acetyltransferase [Microlunatus sp.]